MLTAVTGRPADADAQITEQADPQGEFCGLRDRRSFQTPAHFGHRLNRFSGNFAGGRCRRRDIRRNALFERKRRGLVAQDCCHCFE